ncbi:hypothetical protein J2S53_003681 [Actinopolyspora lacussalsi]|nr:hypothetical protein [Actinopolyspora lacussalsi]
MSTLGRTGHPIARENRSGNVGYGTTTILPT